MAGQGTLYYRAESRLHRISHSRLVLLLGGPIAIAIGSWIYLAVMIDDMSNIPGMSSMMMPGMVVTAAVIIAIDNLGSDKGAGL